MKYRRLIDLAFAAAHNSRHNKDNRATSGGNQMIKI